MRELSSRDALTWAQILFKLITLCSLTQPRFKPLNPTSTTFRQAQQRFEMLSDRGLAQDAQDQAAELGQHHLDLARESDEYQFDANGRPKTLVWRGDVNGAQQHRNRPKFKPHRDPNGDDTIELVASRREQNVADCIQAVYNLSDAQDNPESEGFTLFRRGSPNFIPFRDVEAACRVLVDCVIQQCKIGWTGHQNMDMTNGSKSNKLDRDGSCQSRMENVISALREWKSICKDIVVSDASIRNVANAPMGLLIARRTAQRGNKRKKSDMDSGKAAAQELAQIKCQLTPGSEEASLAASTSRRVITPSNTRSQKAARKASRAIASRAITASSTRGHNIALQTTMSPGPHQTSVIPDGPHDIAPRNHNLYAGTPFELLETPGLPSSDDRSSYEHAELSSPTTVTSIQAPAHPASRKITTPSSHGSNAVLHASMSPSSRVPTTNDPSSRAETTFKVPQTAVIPPGSAPYSEPPIGTSSPAHSKVAAALSPLEFSGLPTSATDSNAVLRGEPSNGEIGMDVSPIMVPAQEEDLFQFDCTPGFDYSHLTMFETLEKLRASHNPLDDGLMAYDKCTLNTDFTSSPYAPPSQDARNVIFAPSHDDATAGLSANKATAALTAAQLGEEEHVRALDWVGVDGMFSTGEMLRLGWEVQQDSKREGMFGEDPDERCKRPRIR
ncbi:hypothetical protein NX059_000388 [Plenodomus lindquistii]|nr:hypothetical protein NX059_000388 [Plenodomus lindquistii]